MDAEVKKKNGLNIKNWDATIYRVFPVRWFKEMVKTKTMGLARPSQWEDPFENLYLKCKVRLGTGETASLKPIASKWYGQSWTKNRDSDAMWRIYSLDKDGVRVSTTMSRLFSAIYDDKDQFATLKYFIGEVEYKSRSEIENFLRSTPFTALSFGGQSAPFARTLCIKRPEFSHEAEVRLLVQHVEQTTDPGDFLNVRFDYAKVLDDEVALDPRLEPAQFEAVKSELLGAGCTLRVTQSDLYKIDELELMIDLE